MPETLTTHTQRVMGGFTGLKESGLASSVSGTSIRPELFTPSKLRFSPRLPEFRTRESFRSMGATNSAPRSGTTPPSAAKQEEVSSEREKYLSVSDAEWRRRLTKEQYDVARKKGTERAFSGEYWKTKTLGTYLCVCCDTPLFNSATKFDSGTGWPSFWEPIGDSVKSETDWSIPFMPRTEVLCAKCDAHLGHVFDDGPPQTGKRYCINSVSLKLKPAEK